MDQFYKVGIFCFSLATIGNLWNLIQYWKIYNIGSKLTTAGNFIFNLFLIAFFYYLYSSNKISQQQPDLIKEEDMNSYVE
jgi:hypothetical protein